MWRLVGLMFFPKQSQSLIIMLTTDQFIGQCQKLLKMPRLDFLKIFTEDIALKLLKSVKVGIIHNAFVSSHRY